MLPNLKTKINDSLSAPLSEAGVVYILTRIVKMLEIEKKKDREEYSALLFYRNWSVHHKIGHPGKAKNDLVHFVQNKQTRDTFLLQVKLREQLSAFLGEYNITSVSEEYLDRFSFYLGSVISDTPVEVQIDSNTIYTVTLQEPPRIGASGLYTISVIVRPEIVSLGLGISPPSILSDD